MEAFGTNGVDISVLEIAGAICVLLTFKKSQFEDILTLKLVFVVFGANKFHMFSTNILKYWKIPGEHVHFIKSYYIFK